MYICYLNGLNQNDITFLLISYTLFDKKKKCFKFVDSVRPKNDAFYNLTTKCIDFSLYTSSKIFF